MESRPLQESRLVEVYNRDESRRDEIPAELRPRMLKTQAMSLESLTSTALTAIVHTQIPFQATVDVSWSLEARLAMPSLSVRLDCMGKLTCMLALGRHLHY